MFVPRKRPIEKAFAEDSPFSNMDLAAIEWRFDAQDLVNRDNEIAESVENSTKTGDWLCCVACTNKITHIAESIQQSGAHRHTFTNPHGFTFHIGCFRHAPGCAASGEETDEFSWFPGRTWRIAVCRRCVNHLGWQFSYPGDEFYGLILNQLLGRENTEH